MRKAARLSGFSVVGVRSGVDDVLRLSVQECTEVFARDGFMLPQPYKCDVINVAPGERWDATVVADNPGLWAFHCHILTHAESAHGMFGMVTVFVVEED